MQRLRTRQLGLCTEIPAEFFNTVATSSLQHVPGLALKPAGLLRVRDSFLCVVWSTVGVGHQHQEQRWSAAPRLEDPLRHRKLAEETRKQLTSKSFFYENY